MLLKQATFARNLNSILKRGLLKAKSTGKLAAVWFCSAAEVYWAAVHVAGRPGGSIRSVIVLEVEVPRSWLKRHRAGLFYVPQDIPPERIRGAVTFGKLAGAPAA
jgi:hypothetical protein